MKLLRFERKAPQAVKTAWGHGRYADPWSILHTATGVTIGIGCLILDLPLWQALTLTIFLSFIYEVWEALVDIVEDAENAVSDVFFAAVGTSLAYLILSGTTPKTLFMAIGVMIILDFIILYIGWTQFLKRRVEAVSGSHSLLKMRLHDAELHDIRDNIFFWGSFIASLPVPYIYHYYSTQIAFAYFFLVFITAIYFSRDR